MTTSAHWRAVGGFDDRFFMYAEEVDLCFRLTRDGRPLLVDPSILLVHDGQSGDPYSAQRRVGMFKGNSTFARKHYGPIAANLLCLGMLVGEWRRFVQYSAVSAFRKSHRARALRAQARELILRTCDWWLGWR